MPRARVQFDEETWAEVTREGWTASDPALADMLNARRVNVMPGPWMPDVCRYLADDAAERLGGKVVEHVPEEPEGLPEGTVY